MNDIDRKIRLYQTLFFLCVIFAVLFLALTIILFFKMKISDTVGYLTGKSKKREIEQLEQGAGNTGSNLHGKFQILQEILLLPTEEVIKEGGET